MLMHKAGVSVASEDKRDLSMMTWFRFYSRWLHTCHIQVYMHAKAMWEHVGGSSTRVQYAGSLHDLTAFD